MFVRINFVTVLLTLFFIILFNKYYPVHTPYTVYLKSGNNYININRYPEKIDHNILDFNLISSSYLSNNIPIFVTKLPLNKVIEYIKLYDSYFIDKEWFSNYIIDNLPDYINRIELANFNVYQIAKIITIHNRILKSQSVLQKIINMIGNRTKCEKNKILNASINILYLPHNVFSTPCLTDFITQILSKLNDVFKGCTILNP